MQPSDRIVAKTLIKIVGTMGIIATGCPQKGVEFINAVERSIVGDNVELGRAIAAIRQEVLEELKAEQTGTAVPYPQNAPQPRV